jgi:hypothetical protein
MLGLNLKFHPTPLSNLLNFDKYHPLTFWNFKLYNSHHSPITTTTEPHLTPHFTTSHLLRLRLKNMIYLYGATIFIFTVTF